MRKLSRGYALSTQRRSYDSTMRFEKTASCENLRTVPFAVNDGLTFSTSVGHGGLKCGACHGDPHTQHTRVVWDCYPLPQECNTEPEGPHGMHLVGQDWVRAHGLQVDENGAVGLRRMPWRRWTWNRSLPESSPIATSRQSSDKKQFAKGAAIGCYSCHADSSLNDQ